MHCGLPLLSLFCANVALLIWNALSEKVSKYLIEVQKVFGFGYARSYLAGKMRIMVKRLLKKYKYPSKKYDNAIETVMLQCEMWTDNAE